MNTNTNPQEIIFDEHELIVSTTDPLGHITYANDIFCTLSGYSRDELMGQPHNILRHPDMPKTVFKLLWDRALAGEITYAFVKNRTKNGDYYWVKAFITPILENGRVVQIASYRRSIPLFIKEEISKVYAALLEYEKYNSLESAMEFFNDYLNERGITYDRFIDRLSIQKSVTNAGVMNIDFDQFYIDHIIFKHNIIHAVKEKKWDTEVVQPCCCRLGKQLKALESMPFTAHPSWSKAIHIHEEVHHIMGDYLQKASSGSTEEELKPLLDRVENNTHQLFSNLHNAIDTYR